MKNKKSELTDHWYFSKWVLGDVQFKKSLKKWAFRQTKSGVLFEKTPKTGLFKLPGALFKSGVALEQIRYLFIFISASIILFRSDRISDINKPAVFLSFFAHNALLHQ